MLTEDERLRLNQIRGYSYAYLFRFVEEYIIGLVDDLTANHDDPEIRRTLEQFLDEERKHQELFSMFERRFVDGFGSGLRGDRRPGGGGGRSTRSLQAGGPPAHRHVGVADPGPTTSPTSTSDRPSPASTNRSASCSDSTGSRRHSTLGSTRSKPTGSWPHSAPTSDGRRWRSSSRCAPHSARLLRRQADLDVESLVSTRPERLSDDDHGSLVASQRAAMFNTFVVLGLRSRHFRRLVDEVHPDGAAMIDAYMTTDR